MTLLYTRSQTTRDGSRPWKAQHSFEVLRMTIYKPARLFASASQRGFAPTIANTPPLLVIDWSQIGQVAPTLLGNPSQRSPISRCDRTHLGRRGVGRFATRLLCQQNHHVLV